MNRPAFLSDDDFEIFKSLIQSGAQIQASAVIRLYKTKENDWDLFSTGIVTFTKDVERRKYFLQLFNMDNQRMNWEIIIGKRFQYNAQNDQYHTVISKNQLFLFCFANGENSKKFGDEIMDYLKKKKAKEEKRLEKKNVEDDRYIKLQPFIEDYSKPGKLTKNHDKKNPKATGRITKESIGLPTNFRHVESVNLHNNFSNLSPEDSLLKKYLDVLDMGHLIKDKKSYEDALNFIENSGGFSKFEDEFKKHTESASKSTNNRAAPLPPPPPQTTQQQQGGRITHGVPPPPPPPQQPQGGRTTHGAPPPPPPGPPPPAGSKPPPPPPGPAPGPPPPPPSKLPNVAEQPSLNNGRGDMLSSIANFSKTNLKSVEIPRKELKSNTESPVIEGGLLGALAKHLIDRREKMNPDSDDDDGGDDDEDDVEWEE